MSDHPQIFGVADDMDQMDLEGPWVFYSAKAALACARRRSLKTGAALLFDLSDGERLLRTFTD